MNNNFNHMLKELCIEVTGKCLMNCVHCSSSCTQFNNQELSIDKIREVLKEAKSLGTQVIQLSGGEPLLHPQISNIINEAKKDFDVRLYTSGYLGDINGIPQNELSKYADHNLDKIIFNLQGSDSNAHEQITKTPGSFNSVIRSIKNAKELGLWVGIHFVPMKLNFDELRNVAQLCKELHVDELAILRFVSQGRGKVNQRSLELDQKEFNQLLLDVVLLKNQYKDYFRLRTGCPMNFCSLIDKAMTPVKCKVGLSTLLINYDGNIVPCPAFKQTDDFDLGNISNISLGKIWQHSQILSQLRSLNCKEIDGCNNCHDLEYCQGRCVAQRYHKYGDINRGPDPLCPYQIKQVHHTEGPLIPAHN